MKLFFITILAIFAVIFSPIIVMWCIDTLFGTHIPVTLSTWFAMLILIGFAGGAVKVTTN